MSAGRKYRRLVARHRRLLLLPEIREDSPAELRNALAIRNAASSTGRCPSCRAQMQITGEPHQGMVTHALMEHEHWCSASDEAIGEIRRRSAS